MKLTPEQKRARFAELAQRDNLCTGQELAKAIEDRGQLLLFDSANRPLVFGDRKGTAKRKQRYWTGERPC
jgi:hypothetical protein